MSDINAEEWVQYLKTSRIISMKSDPITGKLIYKKKVTVDDVIRFLDYCGGVKFATSREIIEKVIPLANANARQEAEFEGFTDLPGNEVSESDVKSVFSYIKDERQRISDNEALMQKEAEISKIKEVISESFSGPQRSIFLNLINAITARHNIVHVAHIEKLFQIFATADPKPRFFGIVAAKKTGLNSEELETKWVEANCPLERSAILKFWRDMGFEDSVTTSHLSHIEGLDNDDGDTYAYKNLLNVANLTIKNFNSNQLSEIIEYVKTAPPKQDD